MPEDFRGASRSVVVRLSLVDDFSKRMKGATQFGRDQLVSLEKEINAAGAKQSAALSSFAAASSTAINPAEEAAVRSLAAAWCDLAECIDRAAAARANWNRGGLVPGTPPANPTNGGTGPVAAQPLFQDRVARLSSRQPAIAPQDFTQIHQQRQDNSRSLRLAADQLRATQRQTQFLQAMQSQAIQRQQPPPLLPSHTPIRVPGSPVPRRFLPANVTPPIYLPPPPPAPRNPAIPLPASTPGRTTIPLPAQTPAVPAFLPSPRTRGLLSAPRTSAPPGGYDIQREWNNAIRRSLRETAGSFYESSSNVAQARAFVHWPAEVREQAVKYFNDLQSGSGAAPKITFRPNNAPILGTTLADIDDAGSLRTAVGEQAYKGLFSSQPQIITGTATKRPPPAPGPVAGTGFFPSAPFGGGPGIYFQSSDAPPQPIQELEIASRTQRVKQDEQYARELIRGFENANRLLQSGSPDANKAVAELNQLLNNPPSLKASESNKGIQGFKGDLLQNQLSTELIRQRTTTPLQTAISDEQRYLSDVFNRLKVKGVAAQSLLTPQVVTALAELRLPKLVEPAALEAEIEELQKGRAGRANQIARRELSRKESQTFERIAQNLPRLRQTDLSAYPELQSIVQNFDTDAFNRRFGRTPQLSEGRSPLSSETDPEALIARGEAPKKQGAREPTQYGEGSRIAFANEAVRSARRQLDKAVRNLEAVRRSSDFLSQDPDFLPIADTELRLAEQEVTRRRLESGAAAEKLRLLTAPENELNQFSRLQIAEAQVQRLENDPQRRIEQKLLSRKELGRINEEINRLESDPVSESIDRIIERRRPNLVSSLFFGGGPIQLQTASGSIADEFDNARISQQILFQSLEQGSGAVPLEQQIIQGEKDLLRQTGAGFLLSDAEVKAQFSEVAKYRQALQERDQLLGRETARPQRIRLHEQLPILPDTIPQRVAPQQERLPSGIRESERISKLAKEQEQFIRARNQSLGITEPSRAATPSETARLIDRFYSGARQVYQAAEDALHSGGTSAEALINNFRALDAIYRFHEQFVTPITGQAPPPQLGAARDQALTSAQINLFANEIDRVIGAEEGKILEAQKNIQLLEGGGSERAAPRTRNRRDRARARRQAASRSLQADVKREAESQLLQRLTAGIEDPKNLLKREQVTLKRVSELVAGTGGEIPLPDLSPQELAQLKQAGFGGQIRIVGEGFVLLPEAAQAYKALLQENKREAQAAQRLSAPTDKEVVRQQEAVNRLSDQTQSALPAGRISGTPENANLTTLGGSENQSLTEEQARRQLDHPLNTRGDARGGPTRIVGGLAGIASIAPEIALVAATATLASAVVQTPAAQRILQPVREGAENLLNRAKSRLLFDEGQRDTAARLAPQEGIIGRETVTGLGSPVFRNRRGTPQNILPSGQAGGFFSPRDVEALPSVRRTVASTARQIASSVSDRVTFGRPLSETAFSRQELGRRFATTSQPPPGTGIGGLAGSLQSQSIATQRADRTRLSTAQNQQNFERLAASRRSPEQRRQDAISNFRRQQEIAEFDRQQRPSSRLGRAVRNQLSRLRFHGQIAGDATRLVAQEVAGSRRAQSLRGQFRRTPDTIGLGEVFRAANAYYNPRGFNSENVERYARGYGQRTALNQIFGPEGAPDRTERIREAARDPQLRETVRQRAQEEGQRYYDNTLNRARERAAREFTSTARGEVRTRYGFQRTFERAGTRLNREFTRVTQGIGRAWDSVAYRNLPTGTARFGPFTAENVSRQQFQQYRSTLGVGTFVPNRERSRFGRAFDTVRNRVGGRGGGQGGSSVRGGAYGAGILLSTIGGGPLSGLAGGLIQGAASFNNPYLLAYAASQVGQSVREIVSRSNELQSVDLAFGNITTNTLGRGTGDRLLDSLRENYGSIATDSELQLFTNRILSIDAATSLDDVNRLAEVGLGLGKAFGRSPEESIRRFSLFLSNESIRRADEFGISAIQIRRRKEELKEIDPDLTSSERFLIAADEGAERALEKIGGPRGITTEAEAIGARINRFSEDVIRGIGESVVIPIARLIEPNLAGGALAQRERDVAKSLARDPLAQKRISSALEENRFDINEILPPSFRPFSKEGQDPDALFQYGLQFREAYSESAQEADRLLTELGLGRRDVKTEDFLPITGRNLFGSRTLQFDLYQGLEDEYNEGRRNLIAQAEAGDQIGYFAQLDELLGGPLQALRSFRLSSVSGEVDGQEDFAPISFLNNHQLYSPEALDTYFDKQAGQRAFGGLPVPATLPSIRSGFIELEDFEQRQREFSTITGPTGFDIRGEKTRTQIATELFGVLGAKREAAGGSAVTEFLLGLPSVLSEEGKQSLDNLTGLQDIFAEISRQGYSTPGQRDRISEIKDYDTAILSEEIDLITAGGQFPGGNILASFLPETASNVKKYLDKNSEFLDKAVANLLNEDTSGLDSSTSDLFSLIAARNTAPLQRAGITESAISIASQLGVFGDSGIGLKSVLPDSAKELPFQLAEIGAIIGQYDGDIAAAKFFQERVVDTGPQSIRGAFDDEEVLGGVSDIFAGLLRSPEELASAYLSDEGAARYLRDIRRDREPQPQNIFEVLGGRQTDFITPQFAAERGLAFDDAAAFSVPEGGQLERYLEVSDQLSALAAIKPEESLQALAALTTGVEGFRVAEDLGLGANHVERYLGQVLDSASLRAGEIDQSATRDLVGSDYFQNILPKITEELFAPIGDITSIDLRTGLTEQPRIPALYQTSRVYGDDTLNEAFALAGRGIGATDSSGVLLERAARLQENAAFEQGEVARLERNLVEVQQSGSKEDIAAAQGALDRVRKIAAEATADAAAATSKAAGTSFSTVGAAVQGQFPQLPGLGDVFTRIGELPEISTGVPGLDSFLENNRRSQVLNEYFDDLAGETTTSLVSAERAGLVSFDPDDPGGPRFRQNVTSGDLAGRADLASVLSEQFAFFSEQAGGDATTLGRSTGEISTLADALSGVFARNAATVSFFEQSQTSLGSLHGLTDGGAALDVFAEQLRGRGLSDEDINKRLERSEVSDQFGTTNALSRFASDQNSLFGKYFSFLEQEAPDTGASAAFASQYTGLLGIAQTNAALSGDEVGIDEAQNIVRYIARQQGRDVIPGEEGGLGDYTIQPGDTYSGLAQRFGLSTSELIAQNPYAATALPIGGQLNLGGTGSEIVPFSPDISPITLTPTGLVGGTPTGIDDLGVQTQLQTEDPSEQVTLVQEAISALTASVEELATKAGEIGDVDANLNTNFEEETTKLQEVDAALDALAGKNTSTFLTVYTNVVITGASNSPYAGQAVEAATNAAVDLANNALSGPR